MKSRKIAYWLRKRAIWLRRIRHRCGYGIHSPFAFNLVTRVVYEKGYFIGYEAVDALTSSRQLRSKDLRLLFRLANDLQPRSGLVLSDDSAALESLTLGCRRLNSHTPDEIAVFCTKQAKEADDSPVSYDFFYTDHAEGSRQIASMLHTAAPTAFIVAAGIHRDRRSLDAWNAILRNSLVHASFDLYDFGFASLDAHYARQHYLVNYL